jgi:hypothetical protein
MTSSTPGRHWRTVKRNRNRTHRGVDENKLRIDEYLWTESRHDRQGDVQQDCLFARPQRAEASSERLVAQPLALVPITFLIASPGIVEQTAACMVSARR